MAELDLKYIKGVGETRAKLLADELDVHNLHDLVSYFPKRHVDRSRFYAVSEFDGEMPNLQVRGSFVRFLTEGEGAKQRLVGVFSDGRSLMKVLWFRSISKISSMYTVGTEYILFGKPSEFNGVWSMVHPEIEKYDPAKPPEGFRGIYSFTDKLRKRNFTQRNLQTIMANALKHKEFAAMADPLPPEILTRLNLMPFHQAVREMHFPTSPQLLQKASERMKFEELFYIELQILRYARRRTVAIAGYVFPKVGSLFNTFYRDVIPFELTGAQKRVMHEIRDDLRTGRQMNRLVQGDVGCGKTMVAFMSMLIAADNGFQSALMAPTEILATQHFETLSEWCGRLGLQCELLTGSTSAKERRRIDEALRDGSLQVLVGTHALLEDKVVFRRLGLAVIDEQHRFGVAQRAKMWVKGTVPPHVLIMTATPIPRTLAMTVYGDLDISVIDELPPGRKPVTTLLRYSDNRHGVDRLIYEQLRLGRQAYLVYPLIHENEKLELQSLEKNIDIVREKFAPFKVCYVHGQMKAAEKDHQMQLFVEGKANIMVATTVIEVGVNVPNATVMVIENAERFGLSQLHQLRGRVGRGADESFCILMTKTKRNSGSVTSKRLNVMTETTDGFLISEADMRLRGPGDMEGTQQSGLSFNLRVANLATDGQVITLARSVAQNVLDSNPKFVVTGEKPAEDIRADLPLTDSSLRLLDDELRRRAGNAMDWSLIS